MSLGEISGKRVSAFSREHRPSANGGANSLQFAKAMDAIDGDLDLVCNWANCRKTLAVIETTTRTDQSVTYRRKMAERLSTPFFHVIEVHLPDGSWRYRNAEPPSPALLTMDEWVSEYEVPLRRKHGCQPWGRESRPARRLCKDYGAECDNDPQLHCRLCWRHLDHWYSDCKQGCVLP